MLNLPEHQRDNSIFGNERVSPGQFGKRRDESFDVVDELRKRVRRGRRSGAASLLPATPPRPDSQRTS